MAGHFVDIAPLNYNNLYTGFYQSKAVTPGGTSATFPSLATAFWFIREFEDGTGPAANHSFMRGDVSFSNKSGVVYVSPC